VPTEVILAVGAFERTGETLRSLSIKHPMIVAGAHSFAKGGPASRLIASLDENFGKITVSEAAGEEPESNLVDRAVEVFRAGNCDGIIAIGGGSALDMGKMVALVARAGETCAHYEFNPPGPGTEAFPLIAVPTTSGSGSETTSYAVIDNSETGRKFTVSAPALFPDVALVDPALCTTMPAGVTLATGLDAWVHATEGCLTASPWITVNALTRRTVELVATALPAVLKNPDDLAARTSMSEASTLGGCIIAQSRTGMIHTISVALAPRVEHSHGLLNAIITPHVMGFNIDHYDGRLAELAGWMGLKAASDAAALDAITAWMASLDVPRKVVLTSPPEDIFDILLTRIKQDGGLPSVNVRTFDDDDILSVLHSVVEVR
jgi:alcohol dehydrogenase class IV